MMQQQIIAGINLYAILKNLEDLIRLDEECRDLIKDKNLSIQFIVRNGPKAWVSFADGECKVGQGRIKGPGVILWFASSEHLNKMFDGKANPVPLKGFTKLGFLQKEFTQITDKLEYYLRPESVKDPSEEYLQINTRFTLTVAAFSLSEIGKYDVKAKISASHMPDGKVLMRVLPEGPSVYVTVEKGEISAAIGQPEKPDAILEMKDFRTANSFLNGQSNTFKAIASGDVMVWGQLPLLDNLSLILDKVPNYVS